MQPDVQRVHPLQILTPRQRMVLYLIARGNGVKQITGVLGISRRTVISHLASAKLKMGASTRAEAVAIGVQNGLLDDEIINID
jgi:DNA-binding CsgD family transcriptional regulator